MKKWLRNAVLGCLLICLPLSGAVTATGKTASDGVAAAEAPRGLTEGFVRAAGDDRLELYIDEEAGEIAVRDLTGDVFWYSSPTDKRDEKLAKGVFKMSLYSLLTLTVVDTESNSQNASTLTSYTECVLTEGGVDYVYSENGVGITLRFADQGITVPLTLSVENGAFCAAVDTGGITETTNIRIRALSLLPYFGAGNSAEEGYMLVPDGCGALIRFNNGKTAAAAYDGELYGADLSKVSTVNRLLTQQSFLPVFGLQNSTGGFLAVIDGAAANAAVHAEVSGKKTGYSAVSALFTLRDSSVVSIGDNQVTDYEEKIKSVGRLSVRYYPYSGSGGYSRMAALYRQYLTETQGVTARKARPAAYIQVLSSYPETKNFLGFDTLRQTRLTGFDETAGMIGKLREAGVAEMTVSLENWDSGSVRETITQKPRFSAGLGGRKGYDRLSAAAEEQDVPLYLSTRIVAYRSNGFFANFRDAARTIENVNIRRYPYSLSTSREDKTVRPQYLLSPLRVQQKTETLGKQFGKKGLTRIAVNDLAVQLYADYAASGTVTRTQSAEYFAGALSGLKAQGMSMIAEGANAYALPYLDAVLAAPVTHSGYDIEDEAVPFYQLVLNGITEYTTPAVNLSSDRQEMLLWALESGSCLLYRLAENGGAALSGSYAGNYSINADDWTENAGAWYAAFREVYDKTDGMSMVSHEIVSPGVVSVTYTNGARLLVNHTASDAVTAYGTVKARSYAFGEGE